MKRILMLVCLLLCAVPSAPAEEAADTNAVLACIQSAYPGCDVARLDRQGNTAAAVLEAGQQKVLCILEKQKEQWRMAVGSAAVLMPQEPLPYDVDLDTEHTLLWRYQGLNDAVFTFRAERAADGLWYFCDEVKTEANQQGHTETVLAWSEAGGGRLAYQVSGYDANDGLLWRREEGFLPAAWLKGKTDLRVFSIADFPALMEIEYDGQWPEYGYLEAAAKQLMPTYTYRGGAMTDGNIQFLMDRPDGARVLAIFHMSSGKITESTPLPKDTFYGVENFTTSLDVNGLCATVSDADTYGISYLLGYTAKGEELRLGPRVVCEVMQENHLLYYGRHPWANIQTMDWSSLPATKEKASARMNADGYALVDNPDPKDRLHLREEPDRSSRSLGKYYNGTPVAIHRVKDDWVHVTVIDCGWTQSGWMMKKYLDFSDTLVIDTNALPHDALKEGAKLYREPQKGADSRTVRAAHDWYIVGLVGEEWYHVWNPWADDAGFLRAEDIVPSNG